MLSIVGASATLLLSGALPAQGARQAFPGTNGAIAFWSDRDGNEPEIFLMNPDGSGQTKITTSGFDIEPAWSPDGDRIAFTSQRDGDLEIYTMNADGSDQTRITVSPSEDRWPAWSPDGTQIAFDSARGGTGTDEIYVMNADGSGVTQVTSNVGGDYFPAWSPDGTKIAFSHGDAIYVIDPDGTGQTQLTAPTGDLSTDDPNWSPDGKQIAYRCAPLGICVMNSDGTGQTQLTSGNDDAPAWSPDGTMIAYDHQTVIDGVVHFDVMVMAKDGSGQTDLTNHLGNDNAPDWQPFTPPKISDLSLRMAGPVHVCAGCPVVYKLRVRDGGPAEADGVVVSDLLPGGTRLIDARSSQGSCSKPPASAAVSCTLGTLAARKHAELEIRVEAPRARTTISNTASVSGRGVDPHLENNSASVETQVR